MPSVTQNRINNKVARITSIIMNKLFVFVGLLALSSALAASTEESRRLPALQHEEVHDEHGQFSLRYVTAEGTVVSERGRLVPTADGKGFVMAVEGEVTYVSDDGKTYVTKYSAGPDGYKAEGEHFPVAPKAPIAN